jgi:hypothetical protein
MKKPVTKKSAAPKAAKAPAKAAKAPAKASKAPAKKASAPAKKKSATGTEPPVTFISAQIDIGFGNYLTIRGEGPGLSWDDGLAMENTGANLWSVALANAVKPVTFKVLVNDLSWNTGIDYVVAPGKSVTVFPTF